mmetsp:Transcript_64788/g.180029  ORF Transcript_64788/g.180029 Transcript_64788/m.180029 type:complete len:268 (-) Transcript_64788:295-1098(-)
MPDKERQRVHPEAVVAVVDGVEQRDAHGHCLVHATVKAHDSKLGLISKKEGHVAPRHPLEHHQQSTLHGHHREDVTPPCLHAVLEGLAERHVHDEHQRKLLALFEVLLVRLNVVLDGREVKLKDLADRERNEDAVEKLEHHGAEVDVCALAQQDQDPRGGEEHAEKVAQRGVEHGRRLVAARALGKHDDHVHGHWQRGADDHTIRQVAVERVGASEELGHAVDDEGHNAHVEKLHGKVKLVVLERLDQLLRFEAEARHNKDVDHSQP